MESIRRLKKQVIRQQKQIDALTTTQTFLFGFLAGLAGVDLGLSARALAEMLQDPNVRKNKYLNAQLNSFKEVSERARGLPEEEDIKLPHWFRGIIKGGLSDGKDDEK